MEKMGWLDSTGAKIYRTNEIEKQERKESKDVLKRKKDKEESD